MGNASDQLKATLRECGDHAGRFLAVYAADAPGMVFELRALEVPQSYGSPKAVTGFFRVPDAGYGRSDAGGLDWSTATGFARAIRELVQESDSARPEGVYLTANPVNPDLLGRANERLKVAGKKTASANDADVTRRRWLVLDVDPCRVSGVSATAAEKEAARAVLDAALADLAGRCWPPPAMLVDSGNGYHAWFRIDLPADDGGTVQRALQAMAARHNTPAAKVDTTVFNPARIIKLPGTFARKGDPTPTRPHRMARVLESVEPGAVAVVPATLLDALAADAPAPAPRSTTGKPPPGGSGEYTSRLDVPRWLTARGVDYRVKPSPDGKGRTVYVLPACPFDPGHGDPDSCIMQAPDGQLSAQCFHDSCRGMGWKEFKEKIGAPAADMYDPPLGGKAGRKRSGRTRPAAPGDPEPVPETTADRPARPARPTIITSRRQYRDLERETLEALRQWNVPPRLFVAPTNDLVELRASRDGGPPAMHRVGPNSLRSVASQAADFFSEGEEGPVDDDPPEKVLKTIPALATWPGVPLLDTVVTYPVFDRGWRLIASHGFHPEAGIYCHLQPGEVPLAVSDRPTAAEVAEARGLILDDLLGDFPFADDKGASRANAVAAMILPMIRPAIHGPTPLHVFDAPTEGTGKTLLVEAMMLAVTGEVPDATSADMNDEEFNKLLLAVLLEGRPVVLLDNANRRLDSASLASVLTATRKSGRVLGLSKTARPRICLCWMVTANNLTTSREIARRAAWTRIDAGVETPATRTGWRHPDLLGWVRTNRGRLQWAVTVLVRNWLSSGRPPGTETMGKYEDYTRAVGGILKAAGIDGFLANAEGFRGKCVDQAGAVAEFVEAWHGTHGQNPVLSAKLYDLAVEPLRETVLTAEGDDGRRKQLGRWLASQRDRIVGGFKITQAGEDFKSRPKWCLAATNDAKPARKAAGTLMPLASNDDGDDFEMVA